MFLMAADRPYRLNFVASMYTSWDIGLRYLISTAGYRPSSLISHYNPNVGHTPAHIYVHEASNMLDPQNMRIPL